MSTTVKANIGEENRKLPSNSHTKSTALVPKRVCSGYMGRHERHLKNPTDLLPRNSPYLAVTIHKPIFWGLSVTGCREMTWLHG